MYACAKHDRSGYDSECPSCAAERAALNPPPLYQIPGDAVIDHLKVERDAWKSLALESAEWLPILANLIRQVTADITGGVHEETRVLDLIERIRARTQKGL